MRPITVTLGPNAAVPVTSQMIRLDEWADAPLGVQVAVTGTVSFTVQHSFDEGPDSLVSPIPLASMFWDTSLLPTTGWVNGTVGASCSIATAPIWMRITLNSGTGSVRMVVSQYNVVEA
jgi:hypothetical protein